MAIFDKKTEENEGEKKKETEPSKKKTDNRPDGRMSFAYGVLIEPWVTEKSHDQMAKNKYIFKINKSSGKKEIKKAVEELYGVRVTTVNVVSIPAKKRMAGGKTGWKSGFKKALVTLKEGDKIELFKGV